MATPPSQSAVLTTEKVSQTLAAVIAVEKNAPDLPGQNKTQIVLDTVSVGVAAAPAVLELVKALVAILNSLGVFKKKGK